MEIKGKGGSLRTGGRTASTLGAWNLDGKTTEWVVGAEILSHNPVWMRSDGPFELRLNLAKGQWCWRNLPAGQIALLDDGHGPGSGGIRVQGYEKWLLIGTG